MQIDVGYFCFKSKKNEKIIWFIPIITKVNKYKKYMKIRLKNKLN